MALTREVARRAGEVDRVRDVAREIAEVARVTEVTVRNRDKEIVRVLQIDTVGGEDL